MTIQTIAGVIRNSGTADFWQPIDNATHVPEGIDSVTTTTEYISVDYTSLGATKVVSFYVGSDEGLLKAGIAPGASVGISATKIYLSQEKPYADWVYWSATDGWVSANGVFTPRWNATTGVLYLDHPIIPGNCYDVNVTGRGDTLLPSSAGVSRTTATVRWHDYTGTLQKIPTTAHRAFVSHGAGTGFLDPQQITIADFPSSNLWLIGMFETP